MDKETWLKQLSDSRRNEVESFLECIVKISQEEMFKSYFRTCGLYAVGSSVKSQEGRDIDITLVGLDFTSVFDYSKVFLQDPDALIEEEIVVPRSDSRADDYDFVTFEGNDYYLNKEKSQGWLLDTYVTRETGASEFVLSLTERLADILELDKKTVMENADLDRLNPYHSHYGTFLGIQVPLNSIDFFIHGENLFTEYWKNNQDECSLPFVVLNEWEIANYNSIFARLKKLNLGYPDFIDYMGRKRVTHFPEEF